MKRFLLLLIGLVLYSICFCTETESGIYYNDGAFQAGKVVLHTPFLGEKYLTINDTTRVGLAFVRKYAIGNAVFLRVTDMMGAYVLANRILEGKISVYRYYQSNMMHSGMPGMSGGAWAGSSEVLYFTLGEGPATRFTHNNLAPILSENPKCLKILKSSKKARTFEYLSYALGAAGICFAIANLHKGDGKSEPPVEVKVGMLLGAGGLLAGFITAENGKLYLTRAVLEYNK